jgi:hypothetical protein
MSVTESKRPKKRHILPFATPAKNRLKDFTKNRLKDFTKNMEMAAVLYLAEATRKKGDHPHLKKTEEKLVFITEACYPIWLIPYNKTTLIFDGFGLASHTFIYDITPDVEVFNKDIQRCEKTDSFIATLTRNMDYFRDFQDKEEIRIEGLVTTPDLREDIRTCLPQMKQGKRSFNNIVFLKPETKQLEIQTGIKQLSALKNKVDRDIENIDASMKFLNAATVRRVEAIKEENKRIRERHSRQIKKTRVKSTERMRQIRNLYNRKIARASKKYKNRLDQLNKKQIRLKKELKGLRKEVELCEAKLKSSKHRNSKRYENHWTGKLEKVRKNLQALRKEIKVNNKRTRDVKKAQKGELAKQRNACCRRIELVNKVFRDRQGSQEAEIIMNHQDIATIEEITRYITKLMQRMLQKKKLFIVKFERIAMPQGKQARRLVYIPFYLVRYEKGDKRRYLIYPPSMVGDMGILAKMKGALGVAKVKTLIQPQSEAMAEFLNQLLVFLEKKPMFEKDVTEAGIQKSMLLNKKPRVAVVKGLKQLESENWISRKELQAFCKILYTYAPSINQRLNTILIPENNYLKCLPT